MTNPPIDPELFKRTAPKWNCVDYPNEGMHYAPNGDCLWCGMTREQRAAEDAAKEITLNFPGFPPIRAAGPVITEVPTPYLAGEQHGRADAETTLSHMGSHFPRAIYTYLPDNKMDRKEWLRGYAGGILVRLSNESPI